VSDLQRFDVYVDGTLDVSPDGKERAAVAAASRLAAAPDQIRKLLAAGRVRVRSNLGADLAEQLVQVLLEVGVRAVRAPAGQKPGSAEFPSGVMPLPTRSGSFQAMKPPPEEPDEMELLDGPPAAQPRPKAAPAARVPTPAPAARAPAPAPAASPARTTARDMFAPPEEETVAGQLEVDADAVESVQRAAKMNRSTLPGVAKAGVAAKAGPVTFRDRLHDTPPLRAALVLVAALLVGALPSYLYASSVDDGRITTLLKEKAEAVRDNRPADSPRAAAVIEKDIQSARSHEQMIFAVIWFVLGAIVSVVVYRFL